MNSIQQELSPRTQEILAIQSQDTTPSPPDGRSPRLEPSPRQAEAEVTFTATHIKALPPYRTNSPDPSIKNSPLSPRDALRSAQCLKINAELLRSPRD